MTDVMCRSACIFDEAASTAQTCVTREPQSLPLMLDVLIIEKGRWNAKDRMMHRIIVERNQWSHLMRGIAGVFTQ